jgi:LysM repeat protein
MKKILPWLFILSFSVAASRAQDAATQQQIDQINGRLQDLLDVQAAQGKHIDALEKEIGGLRDQLNQPGATANPDDLKKLAGQVQELAKKQQVDNDLILKEIEKLGKISGGSTASHKSPPSVSTTSAENPTPVGGAQKGFYYEIKSGNTLSAIAKEYSDQGHKVTVKQILDANPGLDPNNLKVGQKIFIPVPTQ